MRFQFQVWKGAQIIYGMEFPADEAWQFAEFSKIALQDFHSNHPDVSLLDDDIVMKWAKV